MCQQQNNNLIKEEELDEYQEVRKSSVSSSNFNPNFYDPFEIKHRKRTSRGQFKILEKAFINNPKPNAKTRKELAESLSMTPRGVQVWFQNRRAKAKQQQDNRKSHDNLIDDLQVSSPIVLSSSGMIHSRSQSSSSSSTSYSLQHATSMNNSLNLSPPYSSPSPTSYSLKYVTPMNDALNLSPPSSSLPFQYQQPHQQQQQQQGWLSDGGSTITEEMITSSSPLLTPQQKQQEENSWWINDVSGIIHGHQGLFNNSENNFQNPIEDHPLDAWAYINSLEMSNNENPFLQYNRNVSDWISSTKAACNNNNDFYIMLEQQRRPMIEQDEQIMRHLSEPSAMVNPYYNIL